ncbi:unnamed protein product [Triticum turgidum subsp. durum]|uniref:Uncharacterized protein n=1 Tax=Triticum turgidum subsp. durum TaxID=4567 RepID=A0A9R0U3H7_TRITD|nr:unnamed protein product [Triticum turgidum subsp. durum]
MANPLEVTSLGHVQSIVKGYDGIFDLPVRIISIDSLRDVEEIVALLYDKVSEEGGAWRIEEFPLLQRLDKLHDYVRSASTLLDEIDSAVENQDDDPTTASPKHGSAHPGARPVLALGLQLPHQATPSPSARSLAGARNLRPRRAAGGRAGSARAAGPRALARPAGGTLRAEEGPHRHAAAPSARRRLRRPSRDAPPQLFQLRHGNELGVHARLFCIDGIRNARKVFDLMRGKVQDRGWRVFNFQLLPQLAILHDNLDQAQLGCANIVSLLEDGRSIKLIKRRTGERLHAISCTLRDLDLGPLATCRFRRDGAWLPEAVNMLVRGGLLNLANDLNRGVFRPDRYDLAQTVAQDIDLFLNMHLYLDANPGPG